MVIKHIYAKNVSYSNIYEDELRMKENSNTTFYNPEVGDTEKKHLSIRVKAFNR